MINQAFAERYFPNQDPLGHEIRFWGVARRVVGVVGNELFNGLGEQAAPAMYPPISQAPVGTASLLVRARKDPATLVPAVRQVIAGLDDGLAVFRVRTMDDAIAESVARQRFLMQLVGGFAAAALLLAIVGVYGIVAYSVAQRKHEFGVRIALGATSRQVTVLMVKDGLRLAAAGLVLGAVGALSAGKLLSSQLFAVSATDPAAFLTASAAVVLAVLLASYLPARKAGEVSFPGQAD
jgi:putative ABC transport system permease protein